MFLLNMSFISRVKWTIFIFHEWRSHEWNIIIVHFSSEIKDIFIKNIWIFFLLYTILSVTVFFVLYDVIHVHTLRHIDDDVA